MPHHSDGYQVHIVNLERGDAYQEFIQPGSIDNPNSTHLERFIAVEPGQRFSFVVRLDDGFDGSNVVHFKIKTRVDQGTCVHTDYVESAVVTAKGFTRATGRQTVDGTVFLAGFMFGELDLEEDSLHNEVQTAKLGTSLGKLKVTIQPGEVKRVDVHEKSAKGSTVPFSQPTQTAFTIHKRPEASKTASIKLVKKVGIDTNVRPVLEGAVPLPTATAHQNSNRWQFFPCRDRRTFTFHYRSRAAIEKLGMVPDAPEHKIEEAAEASTAGFIEEEAIEVASTVLVGNTLLRRKAEPTVLDDFKPSFKKPKLEEPKKQECPNPLVSSATQCLPQKRSASSASVHRPLPQLSSHALNVVTRAAARKKVVVIDLTEDE